MQKLLNLSYTFHSIYGYSKSFNQEQKDWWNKYNLRTPEHYYWITITFITELQLHLLLNYNYIYNWITITFITELQLHNYNLK